ncbi:site-specific RNA endonuclease [Escherichia phage UPEC01]|nr:site-specific RNA endonuclease [Escherichia phage UPEC01]
MSYDYPIKQKEIIMTTIDSSVYIRRNKLRRIFETEFLKINNAINKACKEAGLEAFFIKYSPHLLDRAIQREIDEQYVFDLFGKITPHVKEIVEFLEMKPLPEVEAQIDPSVNYRPLRLEITDKNLWLGMTVNPALPGKSPTMCCRMAFVNSNRLEGKISTKVIYI